MNLPNARTTDLIEQETNNELLIYDLRSNKAFNLNETSRNVFRACDGKTSFADVQRQYGYTKEVVYLALDELKRENLITGNYQSIFAGISRREAIKKVGLATMAALPIITALIAPRASWAASGTCGRQPGEACTPRNAVGNCCTTNGYCGAAGTCINCITTGNSAACRSNQGDCDLVGYRCCSRRATIGTTLGAQGCQPNAAPCFCN